MTIEVKFHPLADLFPLMEGAEFDELVADIKAHGLHEPIVVHDDMILDGRNRYRACIGAGVEPTFTPYRGDDPVAFVISANLRRRHLNESQRAMVAAKLATLAHGQRQSGQLAGVPTQDEAAGLLNIGERSVRRAADIRNHGAPELVHAVESGAVSVTAAADVAALPEDEQREIVARGEREILQAAKTIRAKKAEERYAARMARIAEVSASNPPLISERRYPVILADPPWDYEVYDEGTGSARGAVEHYSTMKLEEICGLPVADIATDDAILFMWTTAPHLKESFKVLAAWGFEYKTNVAWVKDKIGLGYFVRGQHELLLIATRGNIPSPLPANRPPSVIAAPRREHSRKPDEAYALIERMYPDLPKIELFARNAREGWAAWGNEAAPSAADKRRAAAEAALPENEQRVIAARSAASSPATTVSTERRMMATSYRAWPTNGARRTKAEIAAIRATIREVIGDDPPMTVRQVFYQLAARGVIEKTEDEYQRTVIRLMTEIEHPRRRSRCGWQKTPSVTCCALGGRGGRHDRQPHPR